MTLYIVALFVGLGGLVYVRRRRRRNGRDKAVEAQ
jgi:LPXTG-motif cell wall-anchored protein